MTLLAPVRDEIVPLELTQQVRDISVTERNAFKACRRRWYLDTIENLEPRSLVYWPYEFGTGLHVGLEAYYKTLGGLLEGDPQENAAVAFEVWYQEFDKKIQSWDLGDNGSVLRDELLEYRELGDGMLYNYHMFAEEKDNFTVCCVEGQWTKEGLALLGEHLKPPYAKELHPILNMGRFMVPIVDPQNNWIPGQPYLSARLDLIVYIHKAGEVGFWVIDHKSSGSSPSDRGIEMDDQVTGYDYTFWRHTGIIPRGTIFNYLIKDLPKEPRLVNEGAKLSYAKDQKTLAVLYKQAMIDFGHMKDGVIVSEKHGECYSALLAYGWDRFFKRIPSSRNEHHLKNFELRLPYEQADMRDASDDPTNLAYPHLSQYNCPGCQVQPICQAIEDGSDYESIVDAKYQQAEDRKAKK